MVSLIMFSLLFSCESRHETNGDLAGMWQLTMWQDKESDTIISTKEQGIYYCFNLELIKIFKMQGRKAVGENFYLAYFTHTGDSLFIGNIYKRPSDTLVTYASVDTLGIPHNGKFHVDALSSDKLILSTPGSTLCFRKY